MVVVVVVVVVVNYDKFKTYETFQDVAAARFNVFLQVEHANPVLKIEKYRNRHAKSLVSNVRLDFSQMTPGSTKSFLSSLPSRHL